MSDPGVSHLFVYGSLRSGFRSPAYEYISRYFNLVGEAKVRGKLFDLGSYPAAVPADENSFILGELYAIKNEQELPWALGQLDDYEGVKVEPGDTQLYRRDLAEILINDTMIPAWIYWYNGETAGKPPITSGDVVEYLSKK